MNVDPSDVQVVLSQRVVHSHTRPGIWDPDNGAGKANMPCIECAARARLREAVDEYVRSVS
jgi:hypothetical protein